MNQREFRNALCILRSIDAHELGDPHWWPQFRDDPYLFFLRSDDERAQHIWNALCVRLQRIKLHKPGCACDDCIAALEAKPVFGEDRS